MGDRSTSPSSSRSDSSTRAIARDAAVAGSVFAFAMLWVYGSDNVSFALRWIAPITAAHFLAGFLIGKWRTLLLPIAIVVASIPMPTLRAQTRPPSARCTSTMYRPAVVVLGVGC